MPVKDVDGGMVWQGYNPATFGYKQPHEKPFYFGGSQVPLEVGMKGSGMAAPIPSVVAQPKRSVLRQVKKLPMMRK
jgi:hypothetical protein